MAQEFVLSSLCMSINYKIYFSISRDCSTLNKMDTPLIISILLLVATFIITRKFSTLSIEENNIYVYIFSPFVMCFSKFHIGPCNSWKIRVKKRYIFVNWSWLKFIVFFNLNVEGSPSMTTLCMNTFNKLKLNLQEHNIMHIKSV